MAEQRRFEVGQRLKSVERRPHWLGYQLPEFVTVRGALGREILLEEVACSWDPSRFEPADSPTADPVVEQPKADPYEAHRESLLSRLVTDGHGIVGDSPEKSVFAVMVREDIVADKWNPKLPTNRERLIAGLAAEHTRQADSSGLLHPKEFWSGRRGGRRDG
jgi:hypothetical protein